MSFQLTDEHVEVIFKDCLVMEEEPTSELMVGAGRIGGRRADFNAARLEEHRYEIGAMLDLLDRRLQSSEGGAFSSAYYTRERVQWTTSDERVAQLLLLGLACGFVWEQDAKYGINLKRTLRTASDGALYVGTYENDALIGGNY